MFYPSFYLFLYLLKWVVKLVILLLNCSYLIKIMLPLLMEFLSCTLVIESFIITMTALGCTSDGIITFMPETGFLRVMIWCYKKTLQFIALKLHSQKWIFTLFGGHRLVFWAKYIVYKFKDEYIINWSNVSPKHF